MVRFSIEARDISSPNRPDCLWGPSSLLFDGKRRLFPKGRGMKLATHLNPMLRLRITTNVPLLHPHAFTVCKGTTFLAVPLTSKQAPSSQIPSKYYLPYGKNTISHDGRAPIIVGVRSLVVFLSPCRQMLGLYLNYTMTAFLQILSNSSSTNPSSCKMSCTYDTVGVVRSAIKNINWASHSVNWQKLTCCGYISLYVFHKPVSFLTVSKH